MGYSQPKMFRRPSSSSSYEWSRRNATKGTIVGRGAAQPLLNNEESSSSPDEMTIPENRAPTGYDERSNSRGGKLFDTSTRDKPKTYCPESETTAENSSRPRIFQRKSNSHWSTATAPSTRTIGWRRSNTGGKVQVSPMPGSLTDISLTGVTGTLRQMEKDLSRARKMGESVSREAIMVSLLGVVNNLNSELDDKIWVPRDASTLSTYVETEVGTTKITVISYLKSDDLNLHEEGRSLSFTNVDTDYNYESDSQLSDISVSTNGEDVQAVQAATSKDCSLPGDTFIFNKMVQACLCMNPSYRPNARGKMPSPNVTTRKPLLLPPSSSKTTLFEDEKTRATSQPTARNMPLRINRILGLPSPSRTSKKLNSPSKMPKFFKKSIKDPAPVAENEETGCFALDSDESIQFQEALADILFADLVPASVGSTVALEHSAIDDSLMLCFAPFDAASKEPSNSNDDPSAPNKLNKLRSKTMEWDEDQKQCNGSDSSQLDQKFKPNNRAFRSFGSFGSFRRRKEVPSPQSIPPEKVLNDTESTDQDPVPVVTTKYMPPNDDAWNSLFNDLVFAFICMAPAFPPTKAKTFQPKKRRARQSRISKFLALPRMRGSKKSAPSSKPPAKNRGLLNKRSGFTNSSQKCNPNQSPNPSKSQASVVPPSQQAADPINATMEKSAPVATNWFALDDMESNQLLEVVDDIFLIDVFLPASEKVDGMENDTFGLLPFTAFDNYHTSAKETTTEPSRNPGDGLIMHNLESSAYDMRKDEGSPTCDGSELSPPPTHKSLSKGSSADRASKKRLEPRNRAFLALKSFGRKQREEELESV